MQKKRLYGEPHKSDGLVASAFATTPALAKHNSALISGTAGTLSGNLDPAGVSVAS
jgi:hypothetical protein